MLHLKKRVALVGCSDGRDWHDKPAIDALCAELEKMGLEAVISPALYCAAYGPLHRNDGGPVSGFPGNSCACKAIFRLQRPLRTAEPPAAMRRRARLVFPATLSVQFSNCQSKLLGSDIRRTATGSGISH